MKYEYRVLQVTSADELEQWLNRNGADGFYLDRIETLSSSTYPYAFMMRDTGPRKSYERP